MLREGSQEALVAWRAQLQTVSPVYSQFSSEKGCLHLASAEATKSWRGMKDLRLGVTPSFLLQQSATTAFALVSSAANDSPVTHPGGYLMNGTQFQAQQTGLSLHSCQPCLIYMLIYTLIT